MVSIREFYFEVLPLWKWILELILGSLVFAILYGLGMGLLSIPSGQSGMMIGVPIWAKAGNAATANRRIIRILFIDSEAPWFPCHAKNGGRSPR